MKKLLTGLFVLGALVFAANNVFACDTAQTKLQIRLTVNVRKIVIAAAKNLVMKTAPADVNKVKNVLVLKIVHAVARRMRNAIAQKIVIV